MNYFYCIYNTETSLVESTGSAPDPEKMIPLQPGQSMIVSPSSEIMNAGYVVDGVPHQFPESPLSNIGHFNIQTGEFEGDIQLLLKEMCNSLDRFAEEVRQRFLTPGSGQAMEYQAVYEEAKKYLDGVVGDTPLLQATVDAGYNNSIQEAADEIITVQHLWESVAGQIRLIRLKYKKLIKASISIEEANTYLQQGISQLREISQAH